MSKRIESRAYEIMGEKDFEERIGLLLNEAAAAGDHEQVEQCEIALGCGIVGIRASDREQKVAREECAWALAEAEAKS